MKKINLNSIVETFRKPTLTHFSIIIVNIIPIIGIIFFGWTLFSILFIYWFESFTIGIFNVIKMFFCRTFPVSRIKNDNVKIPNLNGSGVEIFLGMIYIPFFMFHYGMFLFGHLIFINAIQSIMNNSVNIFQQNYEGIIFPVVAIFLSHAVSFFSNFIAKKEYKKTSIAGLMISPYKRVVVMQITLIFGTFILMLTSIPTFVVILFIILKVYFDLKAHDNEHESLEENKEDVKLPTRDILIRDSIIILVIIVFFSNFLNGIWIIKLLKDYSIFSLILAGMIGFGIYTAIKNKKKGKKKK